MLFSLLVAGTVLPLLGQEATQPDADMAALLELMNTTVVTASKVAQNASDAPATVIVVTADTIRRRGYRSLLQVLQDLPDYKVEKRSDPEWYTDFTVRGVNGQDTFVILMDGMKISPSTNERIPIMENYPVNMAKQIEVVYGPASALYGADAVSGVINIITKEGKSGSALSAESTLGTAGDRSRLANFHGTYHFASDVHLTLGGQWFYDPLPELDKSWTDYNGFKYQRAGGPFPTAFGERPFPGGSLEPFDTTPAYPEKTRTFYAILKAGDFSFRLFRNSAKVSSSLTYMADGAIADEGTFLDQSVTVLGATYSHTVGSIGLTTSLTGSRYDLDPASNFRNAFSDMQPAYKYAESSAFKAEQQITWAPRAGVNLVGGISYEILQAIPWSTDLQSPVDPSEAIHGFMRGLPLGHDGQPLTADFFPLKYSNTGSYLQGQFSLSDSLSMTLGARQDSNSRYGTTFNPRAGLVYHLNPRNTFKVLYGSAFLAPSPLLAYGHFGSFFPVGGGNFASAFWRLPNPGLKPMKENTLEASYQGVLGSYFTLSLSLYQTKLTNLHQLVDNFSAPDMPKNEEVQRLYPGNVYKGWAVGIIEIRTNLGEQKNTGGTAKLEFLKGLGENRKVNAYLAYSFVNGKVDRQGNGQEQDIGLITPSTIRLGVEFQLGAWGFSTRYTKVGTQRFGSYDNSGKPYTLEGYGNVDLHLTWDVGANWGLYLEGSNVTDAHYRNINHEWDPQGSSGLTEFRGAPQDPRRIGLGMKIKF